MPGLLKNVLVVTAATGAMGSVQAQTPGNIFDLGTLTPSVTATTDVFTSGSFTGVNLNANLTPGDFSARISGDVVSSPGTVTFSVAANPEPEQWTLLLSGLLPAGFVARRKIGLAAGAPAPA